MTLFFDGAFGTYYSKLSGKNQNCELANINDKATVLQIHKQYIDAGANAVKTNTFGANSNLSDDFELISKIIKSGFEIASCAAKESNVKVFADIGSFEGSEDSISPREEYLRLSKAFIDCGAQNFLFETLSEYEPLLPSLEHIKSNVKDSFIIVSFAVSQDGYTKKGHYYKDLVAQAAKNKNIDAVGLNCICGPTHLYNLIKQLDLTGITFSAMPNSGYPSTVNGRTVFQDNAQYFAHKLSDIYSLGVNILGGCCGTTPEHIALAYDNISKIQRGKSTAVPRVKTAFKKAAVNLFEQSLTLGQKVIAVELDPPGDTNCDYIILAAKKAKSAGADIITVADSPLGRARADSIIMASKIKREAGIEAMPHLSCRDRNHIGIKAALVGANIEGIRNILCVTGDPVPQTERAGCKGVYSFNSFNLISFVNSLNSELFANSPFFIGAALNVNSLQFGHELNRAKRKIQNGAKVLFTQAIFSKGAVENLIKAKQSLNCKIIAGILPVAGYKNALFLKNEVSGIDIPDDFIQSLKDKPRDEAQAIILEYCLDIINKTKDFCDGFYLMTPLKRIDLVEKLVEGIRSLI